MSKFNSYQNSPHRKPDIPWDYLIITASNEYQAKSYQYQLDLRKELGLFSDFKQVLIIPDPGDKRVGSGGSTLHCLLTVLNKEIPSEKVSKSDRSLWLEVFDNLRILIVHAGGDAKRLPPYSPCGKIFVPIPGNNDSALELTLIDRQLPLYLSLPPASHSKGQIVISTGDVLLNFDPSSLSFEKKGITGIGCYADPDLAKNHGVFCLDGHNSIRCFLQKPDNDELNKKKALLSKGQAVLDIGIMNFDPETAILLLDLCQVVQNKSGELVWSGPIWEAIKNQGLDFYREFCCAMGTESTFDFYFQSIVNSGSLIDKKTARHIFQHFSKIPFHLEIVLKCGFLHFGTLLQLINSGNDLQSMDLGLSYSNSCLNINNIISKTGLISGNNSWVDSCVISAPLTLGGGNVIAGLDIETPFSPDKNLCIDIISGFNQKKARFILYVYMALMTYLWKPI